MSELRFVKQTKYANKCAECHNTIPKGVPAFWNGLKGEDSKNYHENCKPGVDSGVVSPTPKQEAGATKRSQADEAPVPLFKYDVDAEYQKLLDSGKDPLEAIELARQKFELAHTNFKAKRWKID